MNMLSVLPVSGWGKKEEIRAIWEAVTSISGTLSSGVTVCSCPSVCILLFMVRT